MALMVERSIRHREELRVRPAVLIVVPLLAIFFQAYLPLRFPGARMLDLPALAVIYFAVARRAPIAGTFIGLVVGIIQDAVTNLPIGVNGLVDCIIGYLAASIGVRIDVENPGTRLIMNFAFILLSGVLHLLILTRLVGLHESWLWGHESIRAAINAVIGVVLFALLDRLRKQE
jgi:rod shape-determining protein MreD